MLAMSASRPFDRPGWIFELKYDGFRVLTIRESDAARLLSRRGNDLADCFPEIVACLRELPHMVLDGELVVLDKQGKPDFERLRRRALITKSVNVQHAARAEQLELFDGNGMAKAKGWGTKQRMLRATHLRTMRRAKRAVVNFQGSHSAGGCGSKASSHLNSNTVRRFMERS